MLRTLSSVTAATLLIPSLLSAQSTQPASSSYAPAPVPASVPAASSPAAAPASAVRAVPVGVQAARDANRPLVANADTRLGAGQNVALMGVGAAALVIGAVVGGSGGTLLAVGGAVVGLYGLYRFLQ